MDNCNIGGLVELSLLGGVRLQKEGEDLALSSQKAKALLGIIALSSGNRRDRRWLREVLWSNSENSAGSLRGALTQIRRTGQEAGVELLAGRAEEVVLRTSVLQIDVDVVLDSIDTGSMDPRLVAEPYLFDDLLTGTEDLDEAYAEWLAIERASRSESLVRKLEAALTSETISPQHRRDVAKCLIAHAPLSNFAVLNLMQALDAMEDYAGALDAFYELQARLDEVHEQEPSPALQSLCIEIKTRSNAPRPAKPVSERPPDPLPRIFVELVDISASPEHRHPIAGAFFEDLVGSLIRFREWRVIGCSGPFEGYRSHITTRNSFRLMISAFDAGNAPMLNIRFTDAHTEIGIWSERIDSTVSGWWTSQAAIVRRLAVALNVRLTETRLVGIEGRSDAALDVHEAWLRAETLYHKNTPESWDHADVLLTEILEHNPNFVHALRSRANMASCRSFFFAGVRTDAEARKRGLKLSSRAVELDPLDGRAQLCFGWANAMNGRWPQAARAFETAHENNPNDPWTMISSAVGLAFCDCPERSSDLSAQAMELEMALTPLHWAFDAVIQFLAGNYDACISACADGDGVAPDTPAWHIAALANTGRVDEAKKLAEQYTENLREEWYGTEEPDTQQITSWLLECYPIRNRETWSRFYDGLAAAGMTPTATSA